MLLSYIFGPSVVKYDILCNNRRSKLHTDSLFFFSTDVIDIYIFSFFGLKGHEALVSLSTRPPCYVLEGTAKVYERKRKFISFKRSHARLLLNTPTEMLLAESLRLKVSSGRQVMYQHLKKKCNPLSSHS